MFSPTKMRETVTTLFSAYASLSASIMLIRSMLNQLIPHNLQSYLLSLLQSWFKTQKNSSNLTLIVKYSHGFGENQVYEAATTYLTTKIGPSNHHLLVGKTENQKHISVAMFTGEEITDCFQNIVLKWKLCSREKVSDSDDSRRKYYEISFDKQFRESVLSAYLPYVISTSAEIKERERALKIYTHGGGLNNWTSIDLEHPITFEKMAMDPELKRTVMDDLKRFVGRKEFYKKVGKAWKRGYLLYGPPGTGKSSLIAAMANYLKFNVYDLELTSISDNMSLRNHLLSTANQSIIAIEDIDCSVKLRDGGAYDHETQPRPSNTKLTLSGLLNVIDGLWSSSGDERIIVFTTNHKDRLDPALLRPGRMDMHIHMSYCTTHGFKTLASNYLGIEAHQLFGEIESLLKSVEITPAEVAEQFMKSEDVDVCLTELVKLLQEKKMKNSEIKDEDGGRVETEAAERPELDGNK